MLDETLQTMFRTDAALETAWAEIERLRMQIVSLNLAADQYSESRDMWMLRAKAAEAELAAARALNLERAAGQGKAPACT